MYNVLAKLRTALARSAELGEATNPPTVEVATDPVLASHQASALAPIATIDQHALLAEGGQLEDPAGFVKRINALMLELAA